MWVCFQSLLLQFVVCGKGLRFGCMNIALCRYFILEITPAQVTFNASPTYNTFAADDCKNILGKKLEKYLETKSNIIE